VVTAAAESEAEDADAEQVPAAATPREVIEKLAAAKVTLTCEPHLWTGALCFLDFNQAYTCDNFM